VARSLTRRPAVGSAVTTFLVLAVAWRRFLDGSHSPFFDDVEQYHYPVSLELARAWSEGRLALWTDRVYLGFPFFADPQTAAWYPGTLLIVGLGPHLGYVLFLFFHSLLAAAGATGLARSHGCAWPAAWASGLLVSLAGYFAHEIRHPGLFAILAWLPAWLWATHLLFQKQTARRVALAGLPVAMMILAGTLQVLFGAAILYGFYIAGLGLDAWQKHAGRRALQALAASIAAPLLGLCLAAVVLLPTLAHFPHTARALGMSYAFGSMGSVPPVQVLSFVLAPAAGLFGFASDFGTASFYVGALSLPLAVVAVVVRSPSRWPRASSRSQSWPWASTLASTPCCIPGCPRPWASCEAWGGLSAPPPCASHCWRLWGCSVSTTRPAPCSVYWGRCCSSRLQAMAWCSGGPRNDSRPRAWAGR